MRSPSTCAVAALLVLGLAACSSGSSSTPAAPAGGYGAQPGSPSTAAAVPRGPVSIGSVSRTGAPLGSAAAPAVAMPTGGRVSNDPRITNHLGRQLPAGGGGQWVRPMGNQAPRAIFYVFAFPG